MAVSVNTPSSGPSGHLLPAGEKEGCAAPPSDQQPMGWRPSHAIGTAYSSFSPAGRRWPEGPDEGVYAMPSDDITKRRPGKTTQARRLRQNETEEEYRLWSDLRNRHLNGYKFARQVPLGPYVVDFLCREERLIIEIDGFHHEESCSDEARTHWLNRTGYSVLRFWNHEITRERRAVLDTILAALTGRMTDRCDVTRFHPASTETHKTGEQP
ncbi:endonuclease domain-containing protein [Neorhizobium sp. CSC1952]|uniref:endonuclease domain-containing protein n=1 Tax=Neorhizobium sp. CSC1952 TaxID=2978974 RepID=UPI0025A4E4EA|nr:endonuclease domain-containing protein [Rhizobium sp. CSC1952]WJR65785.1 endonuclease domain-containing protein [Rhizobium sp. CSC1952]